MKIIFVSSGDPKNRRQWSGTVSYIFEKLIISNNVVVADISGSESKFIRFVSKMRHYICRVFGKRYSGNYSLLQAKKDSKYLQKIVNNNQDADFIFCVSKSGAIAYLQTKIPIIYLCDATFNLLDGYYDHLKNMSCWTKREGNLLDKKAINNAKIIICASKWAQQSVVNDYGATIEKTLIIPFGANCNVIKYIPKGKLSYKILFCGVEWHRKGGQIAVDTICELNKRGLHVELYLVGCMPPKEINSTFIHVVGFLNKNKAEEANRLESLYQESDLLLLPTVAECAGIVFAEAASRGLPSIAFNTGGVSNYVIDGITGYTLPMEATHMDFADKIEGLYMHKEQLLEMSNQARQIYDTTLNWDVWKEKTEEVLKGIVKYDNWNNDFSSCR